MRTEHRETKDHKIMNTDIKTIGFAALVLGVIKLAVIAGVIWLSLTFIDSWVHLAFAG